MAFFSYKMTRSAEFHCFVAVVLALSSVVACKPDTEAYRIDRLVPRTVEPRNAEAEASRSTAAYPRAELGGQARVIAEEASAFGGARIHLSRSVDLRDAVRIEFAYGLSATVPVATKVAFTVSLRNSEHRETVYDHEVVAGPSVSQRWIDVAIAIEGWTAETEIEIQSYTALADVAGIFVAMPTIVRSGRTNASAATERPNILLMSLDTLRADHLGLYGYERATSPNMDRRFGRDGVVVRRMFSQASDTVLGHTAMLYGKYPCTAVAPASGSAWRHDPNAVGLAERLAGAGYRTAAFTEDAMVAGAWGFARGFDLYDEETHAEREGETVGFIEQTFGRGLSWLKRRSDDVPFFLFLHTYQVHAPYTPPKEYSEFFPTEPTATQATRDRDLYDREIRYADDQVERVFRALEAFDLLDQTIVIVTSDHGEEFGDHGGRYHGFQLYDEILRVPLLVRGPGIPVGEVREGPVALLDLPSTILELAGVTDASGLDGHSVAGHLVTGGQSPWADQTPVFAEARGKFRFTYESISKDWLRPVYAGVAWPYKILRHRTTTGPHYELFDLSRDSAERRDLMEVEGRDHRSLVAAIERYAEQCRIAQVGLREAQAGRAVGVGLDRAHEDKLRALGYIE